MTAPKPLMPRRFPSGELNARAVALCRTLPVLAAQLRVGRVGDASHAAQVSGERASVKRVDEEGDTVAGIWDFGQHQLGGLAAGQLLARVCLADLADVRIQPVSNLGPWPEVTVTTDHPVAACMGSQYAGWRMAYDGFFAMGSGPMRAAAAHEPLIRDLELSEPATAVVGICETSQLPTDDIVAQVARACHVSTDGVTLLVAPTKSLAGTVQVVARSIETALHQMHERGADLRGVVAACGAAPLPPVAANDLKGIGRTNDAILYGGRVTLWMYGEDGLLESLSQQITSAASADHGAPFAEIFARYGHDFYRVDPHLFAPAQVTLVNVTTGRSFTAGSPSLDILYQSFGTERK